MFETRQERREKKRQAKKSQMTHHGKSIAIIYKKGIEKRAAENKPE
jgi:ribosomal protein L25 (general stress protein Ctc)